MFQDRTDAGRELARALEAYRGEDALVLAIPRGGVEVGFQVARYLQADFSILIARKLPFPDNPESGFGAIAEDGSTVILDRARHWTYPQQIDEIAAAQQAEIERRIEVLRQGRPLPTIEGRTVILVDDGIAMGSTMRAAIRMARHLEAGKVVVAVPVAGPAVAQQMDELADDTTILLQPRFFRAVAQVYRNWYDVPDREVLQIMQRWKELTEEPVSTEERHP